MVRGFSIIEVLVVTAIAAALIFVTAPLGLQHYQNAVLISERDSILGLLRRARTLALVNQGGAAHGLSVSAAAYTLFEGPSFLMRNQTYDETFPRSSAVTVSGAPEIVFAPLAATSSGGSINLAAGGFAVSVSINSEGGISW